VDNALAGSIPTEIGGLTDLKFLKIQKNDITGTIPTEFGEMTNLENIRLNGNELTGTLPSEIGNLASLRKLFLSEYNFIFMISLSDTSMINHQNGVSVVMYTLILPLSLYVSESNNLTGSIPAEICALDGLTIITELDQCS